MNYETGWGEMTEYNVAVIWQFQPSVIAIFQSQQRRTPVVERQVDRFKLLAKRLTHKAEARDENQFGYGEILLTPGTPFMDPDEWVANLSSVYVCDTRSVGRDCPEGWHKAKAASSVNE